MSTNHCVHLCSGAHNPLLSLIALIFLLVCESIVQAAPPHITVYMDCTAPPLPQSSVPDSPRCISIKNYRC